MNACCTRGSVEVQTQRVNVPDAITGAASNGGPDGDTMIRTPILAAGFLLASATAAFSYSDARARRQADSIEWGREAGKITWTEGLKLRAEQRGILRLKDRYASDGSLDDREHEELARLQDLAQVNIKREIRDSWSRASWLPRIGK